MARVWGSEQRRAQASDATCAADDDMARFFELRRAQMVTLGRTRPHVRVAAFLSALSQRNRLEGRNPLLLDDVVDSNFVAEMLGLGIADLAHVLRMLKDLGVVGLTDKGDLSIENQPALEAIALCGAADAHAEAAFYSDWRIGAIEAEIVR